MENRNELTPEKLRAYKGFENCTDEEAEKQIHTIKKLAKVLYHLHQEDERKARVGIKEIK